ncbi:hypothetical protein [Streptomyces sp. NPDC001537]
MQAVSRHAEALDGADVAAATTHAVEPVIRLPWLPPGVHITSVCDSPADREIDDPLLPTRRARRRASRLPTVSRSPSPG